MRDRPVLYLDLDDTLVTWADGHPRAAPGARDFLRWASVRFELRWLTTWCPDGEMDAKLLADLAHMLGAGVDELAGVRGVEWHRDGSKLDGVAWVEHLVLDRPFVWLEDDYGFGERERAVLEANGLLHAYWACNVTTDPGALARAHDGLRRWWRERQAA